MEPHQMATPPGSQKICMEQSTLPIPSEERVQPPASSLRPSSSSSQVRERPEQAYSRLEECAAPKHGGCHKLETLDCCTQHEGYYYACEDQRVFWDHIASQLNLPMKPTGSDVQALVRTICHERRQCLLRGQIPPRRQESERLDIAIDAWLEIEGRRVLAQCVPVLRTGYRLAFGPEESSDKDLFTGHFQDLLRSNEQHIRFSTSSKGNAGRVTGVRLVRVIEAIGSSPPAIVREPPMGAITPDEFYGPSNHRAAESLLPRLDSRSSAAQRSHVEDDDDDDDDSSSEGSSECSSVSTEAPERKTPSRRTTRTISPELGAGISPLNTTSISDVDPEPPSSRGRPGLRLRTGAGASTSTTAPCSGVNQQPPSNSGRQGLRPRPGTMVPPRHTMQQIVSKGPPAVKRLPIKKRTSVSGTRIGIGSPQRSAALAAKRSHPEARRPERVDVREPSTSNTESSESDEEHTQSTRPSPQRSPSFGTDGNGQAGPSADIPVIDLTQSPDLEPVKEEFEGDDVDLRRSRKALVGGGNFTSAELAGFISDAVNRSLEGFESRANQRIDDLLGHRDRE